jgi:hypothetical protein
MIRLLASVSFLALFATPALADSLRASGEHSMVAGAGSAGSGLASAESKQTYQGKVEGLALFSAGVASAGSGAVLSGSAQSGSVSSSSASSRDWSKPVQVSDDTVVAQPVPAVPYEPTAPAPKQEPQAQ